MHRDDNEDDDRMRSICEGLRRGLARAKPEPLPSRVQELLRLLQTKEQTLDQLHGGSPKASASQ
jgi:hypothetical protein